MKSEIVKRGTTFSDNVQCFPSQAAQSCGARSAT